MFRELDAHFHFMWDVAATAENARLGGGQYFGPDHELPQHRDALTIPWASTISRWFGADFGHCTVWMNPPYSRGMLRKFLEKAVLETANGITTVALLPGDTSTKAFHELMLPYEHYFQIGRNSFAGAPLTAGGKLAPAKFGSILTIYRPPMPARWACAH